MKKKTMQGDWQAIHNDLTPEGIKRSFLAKRTYTLAKDPYTATLDDNFKALALLIRDRLAERWIATQQEYHKKNVKRVYYLSLEFLIGRLLSSTIINLDLWDEVKAAMDELGLDVDDLRDCEADAGLGNGGLGRLAACFLDSMATIGIPAQGYGIRYDYGIFKQKIINGYQVEFPDEWLSKGNPWEFARPEYTTLVKFYGRTYSFHDAEGKLRVMWVDTEDVLAMPYDIPIGGYKNGVVNTLRLWSARSSEEFDLKYFNDGDYEGAVYNKAFSESISKVLYPNDSISQGKELRLKQEYFFTAASIRDIIRRFKVENNDFTDLPNRAAIQLNDTHPSLAIVELMRILLDEEGVEWDIAWDITKRTFAYTNHTVMPEALERWPLEMFERLLPRHIQLIYEVNRRFLREVAQAFPNDPERLRRMSLIDEEHPKRVRMANLAIIGSHSINGVSELHTSLLKSQLFKDFYELFPDRFNNKTNGITQRRWLQKSNTGLSSLITETIGDEWTTDLNKLAKIGNFVDDAAFREKWQAIKKNNKQLLADHIRATTGVLVNTDSIFDVQIKRIHEYKRQLLFGFFIISEYLRLKENPSLGYVPRTFIIGGKSAPGYVMAKRIIKFLTSIADVINTDKTIGDKIKVVFLENYRVSLAEKIFPASDLSEQISTAGTEASGTGCMKFMMNGALTIGTWDGANIEMAEAMGRENMFIFGRRVEEIKELVAKGYRPQEFIDRSPMLKSIVKLVKHNFFSPVDTGLFDALIESVLHPDRYYICADFDSYTETQQQASALYHEDHDTWVKKSIINVACSGRFSSDRTVSDYAREIWGIPIPNTKESLQ